MFFWDSTMILLIPGILLGLFAQYKITKTFNKYMKVRASSGLKGVDAATQILEEAGIFDVRVEETPGHLTDHYDPKAKKLRLSTEVYHGTSLAALGVAAHEAGHAVQHDVGYVPLVIRSTLAPVVQIGSMAWMPLFLLGMFLGSLQYLSVIGVYIFAVIVLFQLITLPVEFNASSRAIALLESGNFISREEVGPTKRVLNAAALTYVAGAVTAVLTLIRLLILSGMLGGRNDD
jgi:uncharacterized protein